MSEQESTEASSVDEGQEKVLRSRHTGKFSPRQKK